MVPTVRLSVVAEDLEALQAVEAEGDALFAEIGLPGVERWEPSPVEELVEARAGGRLWVACVPAEPTPVGFARTALVDGGAHLEQLSVRRRWMGRGVGSALVEAVAATEAARGLAVLTLTTYRDIPWNGPWYARRGFSVVDPADWTPGVRARRDHEVADGFDVAPRVVLRRPLGTGTGVGGAAVDLPRRR